MYHYCLRGNIRTGCADVDSLGEIVELMGQTPYKVAELKISDVPITGGLWSSYCPYPVTANVGGERRCVGYSSFIDYGRTEKTNRRK